MKFKNLPLIILTLILFSNLPMQGQSLLKKANKEYELQAFNLAIKTYRKVLEKSPKEVEALSKIADCYRHLNQMNEAQTYYKLAVDQEGLDPIHLLGYGKTLMATGNYEDAKKWFEVYAEGQPYVGAHYAKSCDFAVSMQGLPAFYRVKNEYANSDASDFGANFFKDKIVLASARADIRRTELDKNSSSWTGLTKSQLFITDLDGNRFLNKPSFLRSDLSNTFSEGPLSYTANGKMVAFTKNNFVDGTRQIPSSGMETSIYFAEATENGDWKEAVPFVYNGSGYSSGFPSLSADGKVMYFSSNRPDGYGGWDIYVTYNNNGTWSTPENIGPVLNSEGNELHPFFDGTDLYFSSDWHHGYGGLDVFKGSKVNGNWEKVFHMGNGINSPRDDYGYVFNKQMNIGYFASNRIGGKGKEDIYQVTKKSDQIVIKVINALDKNPVAGVSLDFSSCGEPVFTTDANGLYSLQALAGLDCEVVASKEGFSPYAFQLKASGKKETMTIEVLLSKESDRYLGRIINATNNEAIKDVFVRATDQNSGQVIETYSDAQGSYRLPLTPESTYVIRYSKAGFLDTHNRINSGAGSDKSILGVIPFSPSSTVVTSVPNNTRTTKTTPSTIGGVSSVTPNQKGYSVQISAVYGNERLQLSDFDNIRGLGNMYTKPENGYKKLRMGIFESKDQANSAQEAIKRAGYNSAFIVTENLTSFSGVEVLDNRTGSTNVETEPIEEEVSMPLPAPKPVKTSSLPEASPFDSPYKVRLAAYKNTNFFQEDKVEDYGSVERIRKGDFTIMFLSGYNTLQEAKEARKRVIANGFKSAYVVKKEGNEMKRVN